MSKILLLLLLLLFSLALGQQCHPTATLHWHYPSSLFSLLFSV